MKAVFIGVFLFITTVAAAQIVNFPDAGFKQFLVNYNMGPVIDTNGDGEIQVSEALAVTALHIPMFPLVSDMTGIKAFQNLEGLLIDDQQNLLHLDLSNMASLKNFSAGGIFNIDTLDISGCVNLESLNILYGAPQHLKYDPMPKLRYIGLSGAAAVGVLDLTASDSLQSIRFEGSNLQKLDVRGLTKLKTILAGSISKIDSLLATNCTSLKKIECSSYNEQSLFHIDLTGCVGIDTLSLYGTGCHTLDLSTCINLKYLSLFGPLGGQNQLPLEYLNLKNGSLLQNFLIGISGTVPLLRVCADDFEVAQLQSQLLALTTVPFFVSSSCTFSSGGTYNTIRGKISIDLDLNGCDIADPGMYDVPIRINDGTGNSIIRYSSPDGEFRHYPYAGNFTVAPYFLYAYFNLSPSSANIVFDTANSLIDTVDFCIATAGIHPDLDVSFLPVFGLPRPGFASTYKLLYRNRGNTSITGNVQLNFDNSKMTFGSASVTPTTQSPGQLAWNYSNLAPFQSGSIIVSFTILPPPINNLDDTLTWLAVINPVAGDDTPYDNSFILPQRVVGSFDPNDKQCLEGSKLDITRIGEYLHYVVRFQNEGTATATFIVVADTLSSKYDWESFDFLGSSHPCHVKRMGDKLEFYFENINLPQAAVNEPGSHGFVAFRIKPRNNIMLEDSLNNKAAIYFDFNPPVITNIATTIVTNNAGPVAVKLEYFSASARGDKNLLTWKAACSDASVTFSIEKGEDPVHFKSIGSIQASNTRCLLPFDYIDNVLIAGKNYYRIKVTDINGISFYSKVIVVGNSRMSGIEIQAVAGNIIYMSSDKQQTIQMKVIAADGSLAYIAKKTIAAGNNIVSLPLQALAAGIYSVQLFPNQGNVVSRLFVKY
jgi:uncharacterized repeat protein (TIGR01451 family)